MSRILLILGAVALLAACSRHDPLAVADPRSVAAAAQIAATPQPMNAPDFVQATAIHNMFEVQTAKLAQERSKSAQVRAYAAQMIKDNNQSTAGLKAVISTSSQTLTLPSIITADLQTKLDNLTGIGAAEFDKTYLEGQVIAQQEALTVLNFYADKGDMPALKAFAGQTAALTQLQLGQAKTLRDSFAAKT